MIWTRPDFMLASHVAHTPRRINLPQEGQRITLSSASNSINTPQLSQK